MLESYFKRTDFIKNRRHNLEENSLSQKAPKKPKKQGVVMPI